MVLETLFMIEKDLEMSGDGGTARGSQLRCLLLEELLITWPRGPQTVEQMVGAV